MFENYKKELGISLQEMKSADWFKDLPKESQELAIQNTKEFYTPPNKMENTILNIALNQYLSDFPFSNISWKKWLDYCAKNFTWANPTIGNGQINLHKRRFASDMIIDGSIL